MFIRVLFIALATSLALVACAPGTPAPTPTATPITAPTAGAVPTFQPARDLVVMTHDSFEASESVIKEFETANNAKVKILKSGDAGASLNKAILAKGNPLADAFFGVDNSFLSRAIKADIFDAYKPASASKILAEFALDANFQLTPVDYGDVCMNYDRAYFEKKNLPPPQSLEDLTKSQYKSLTVIENPATSSPGLAFLLATVGHFGKDKYLDFWKAMRANDVLITEGWSDAYYAKSTWGGKGGDRPIVLSYATSPAAEVFFSNGKMTTPPTGNILGDDTCFRQIEFVGVLKGAKNPDLARKFVDFMLTTKFQEDVPSQMFVFPVMSDAKLPDFFKFAEKPKKPALVSPAEIDTNRDEWIKAWTNVVLR
ncbi:MAG: thiamine ABC transporter substrate-binding protein [Chloroflexi bacterium]|nr:thiamine ABC transporter substrate-binding protein [Chloroflexota bacterium]